MGLVLPRTAWRSSQASIRCIPVSATRVQPAVEAMLRPTLPANTTDPSRPPADSSNTPRAGSSVIVRVNPRGTSRPSRDADPASSAEGTDHSAVRAYHSIRPAPTAHAKTMATAASQLLFTKRISPGSPAYARRRLVFLRTAIAVVRCATSSRP